MNWASKSSKWRGRGGSERGQQALFLFSSNAPKIVSNNWEMSRGEREKRVALWIGYVAIIIISHLPLKPNTPLLLSPSLNRGRTPKSHGLQQQSSGFAFFSATTQPQALLSYLRWLHFSSSARGIIAIVFIKNIQFRTLDYLLLVSLLLFAVVSVRIYRLLVKSVE